MNFKNNEFNTKNIKVVFFGTPDFAATSLLAMINSGYNIIATVTQPDRPVGRKQILTESSVKVLAKKFNIPVLQPEKIRKNKEFKITLQKLAPDLIIVAAYGKIIPNSILEIPQYSCLNIHGSLLPKYRGASPIQTSLQNGDTSTGITIIVMDKGMDTGDIVGLESIKIEKDDTSESLYLKLADLGASTLSKYLPPYIIGTLKPQKQDDSKATYTKIINKADGQVDWAQTSTQVYNNFRGLYPWPGIFTFRNNKRIKLLMIEPSTEIIDAPIGEFINHNMNLLISCGEKTAIKVIKIQPEGKKPMAAKDFLLTM